MSFLNGNDYTSLWSDVTGIVHNAVTGELTDSQKADIAKGTTQLLTQCQGDPSSEACQQLLKQNTEIVNKVAPSTNCAIRLPVYGCVENWGNLAAVLVVVIIATAALYGYFVFNPRRL